MHLEANAATVCQNQKACILLWLGGGPPSIDMWDMKPGSKNGGEFKPIRTTGGYEISELLPKTAKVADKLSIVRSMSTARPIMAGAGTTSTRPTFPNPTVVHPSLARSSARNWARNGPGWKSWPSFPSAERAKGRASWAWRRPVRRRRRGQDPQRRNGQDGRRRFPQSTLDAGSRGNGVHQLQAR